MKIIEGDERTVNYRYVEWKETRLVRIMRDKETRFRYQRRTKGRRWPSCDEKMDQSGSRG
ncbi:hypothetical protein PUN28_006811 [Cardiocondyla obscurior]|uniref:Uncharacterized protein n=1 Tax=Cardiocondyla obscurior TaxID=286306 RepID=A0AAW2G669_9HYME